MTGIEYIKKAVSELLKDNSNGHDDKHVFRVYNTAMKFCDEIPSINRDLVAAAALLHDCDDYKLFGEQSERLMTNTRRILANSGFDDDFCDKCINIVKTIGYSKRLKGIKAYGIEGAIVSDADMCDASGAIGMFAVWNIVQAVASHFLFRIVFQKKWMLTHTENQKLTPV